jgi:hypothetical protein
MEEYSRNLIQLLSKNEFKEITIELNLYLHNNDQLKKILLEHVYCIKEACEVICRRQNVENIELEKLKLEAWEFLKLAASIIGSQDMQLIVGLPSNSIYFDKAIVTMNIKALTGLLSIIINPANEEEEIYLISRLILHPKTNQTIKDHFLKSLSELCYNDNFDIIKNNLKKIINKELVKDVVIEIYQNTKSKHIRDALLNYNYDELN